MTLPTMNSDQPSPMTEQSGFRPIRRTALLLVIAAAALVGALVGLRRGLLRLGQGPDDALTWLLRGIAEEGSIDTRWLIVGAHAIVGGIIGAMLAAIPYAVLIILQVRETLYRTRSRTRMMLAQEMEAVSRKTRDVHDFRNSAEGQ